MFESESEGPLSRRAQSKKTAGPQLDQMSPDELLSLYEQVRELIPPIQISKMNVEEELLLQFHTIRKLQTNIIEDDDIPANQRAVVANSVGTSLERISKMQDEIYDSERFKRIESLVIRLLKRLPKDTAAEFIKEYEAAGFAEGLS